MKSKLSVALAAGACVLGVSPAIALSVTNNPGTTVTSVPGAVVFDDFDSVVDTTIGTITGGVVKGPASGGPGSPVATGNFIYAGGNDPTSDAAPTAIAALRLTTIRRSPVVSPAPSLVLVFPV